MAIVPESTSCLSLSLPDPDPELIHGVPLAKLLVRCASIAGRYYRQQHRWEPYEEYIRTRVRI